MKLLHSNAEPIAITPDITVYEYCKPGSNLPLDGAYCKINGILGPKINHTFTELFFVTSGKLYIEIDGVTHVLSNKDMYIVPMGQKHKLTGEECEVFIACSP